MGLLRAAARTAVVAGTATHVHGRVAARQQNRWAQQTAAPPAPVSPERDTATLIAQLKELGQLRDAGVLSEAEFEVQKARILHR
ncbi:SHOCT domain-containing protein [Paractinoplanes maris]|uniref:SHOCT domain-containing protein n=1 Tax=Paractinoplanes maris TaxID=1734446 RepID=UPI002022685A|nr:SHOCT domain-containing protein [Actinoplanes maris]